MTDFSDSALRRWRRLILVRDGGICRMCAINFRDALSRTQVHHIYPKGSFPNKAYELSNGILLCLGCHQEIVHAGNSFLDITRIENWRFFVPSFNRWVDLSKQRRFNELHQNEVDIRI